MIRAFLFFLLFFSFPLTGCYSQGEEEQSERAQVADPYAWDFGRVNEGETLEHDFILKNESQSILMIKDVNTSCGCTVSKVKEKAIAPGESTVIDVKFNSKGYSGNTQQFVYVHTDSLKDPIIKLVIKAEVVKSSQQPAAGLPTGG